MSRRLAPIEPEVGAELVLGPDRGRMTGKPGLAESGQWRALVGGKLTKRIKRTRVQAGSGQVDEIQRGLALGNDVAGRVNPQAQDRFACQIQQSGAAICATCPVSSRVIGVWLRMLSAAALSCAATAPESVA